MRYILILVLLTLSLYAKDEESCYTIQLLSKDSTQSNIDALTAQEFPQECMLMEIGSYITVRCGCYEEMSRANEKLPELKSEYEYAYLARTYKYRFEQGNTKIKPVLSTPVIKEEVLEIKKSSKSRFSGNAYRSSSDDELKLILSAFLYNSDVENAYQTAKIGYKKNPSSHYWNQKMAETSRWTGRTDESIGYMMFAYKARGGDKEQEELITYGKSIYQYEKIEYLVVEKARKNPTKENIDDVIDIYSKTGSPEKSIAFLDEQYQKNPDQNIYLTQMLKLYLEIGDLDSAKRVVNIMEEKELYSLENSILISSYYYLNGDMQESYDVLLLCSDEEKNSDLEYNKLLSDISWYIQDYPTGAKASKRLMQQEKARLVDYERIIYIYRKKDAELVYRASKESYQKHKLSYLFYGYANSALELKKFDTLRESIVKIDKSDSSLKKDTLFWIIKSKVYEHFNESELRREALDKVISMDPNNQQNRVTLFYFFMESGLNDELSTTMREMSEDKKLNPAFYMPMASAYMYLQDIDSANYYMQKLIVLNHPDTQTLEFKFLMAYIYQAQDNEQGYKKQMLEIGEDLDAKSKRAPAVLQTNNFLSYYLRSAMYTIEAQRFQNLLEESKEYLTKKNYDEISYSWAVYNNADEKSHEIYQNIQDKEVWLRFSNALMFKNHTEIENIFDAYLASSTMGNISPQLAEDGQVAAGQTVAFDSLESNSYSLTAYQQHLTLSRERSDEFDAHVAYYNRDPLLQKYIKTKNSTYISRGWYVLAEANYFENSIIDDEFLVYTPSKILQGALGIRRIYDRGYIEFKGGIKDAQETYNAFSVLLNHRLSTDLNLIVGYDINKDAMDTIPLILAGKKDTITLDLTWSLFHSTAINFLYEYNEFSSQDEVDIGDGHYGRVSATKQFRLGYPDWTMGTYVDFGIYDEIEGAHGVLDKIDNGLFSHLPEDFYTVGATFTLGMQNARAYTRVWRPYLSVTPYFDSPTESINYSFDVGYGGALLHQDHLSVGATYAESVFGTSQSTFEIYLKYQFLYTNP